MKLTDIKRAINAFMRDNFPDYMFYAGDINEGFKRPCFFIELLPVARDNEGGGIYSRRVSVIISYFSKSKTDLENIKMQDQFEKIFGQLLKINDRFITIDSTSGHVTEGVLHFSFNIDYLDSIDETEQYGYDSDAELMQELEINFVKED